MRSRALCIPFHRYHPHTTEHYRVWMKALLDKLEIWKDEFDKLYLIDDYWNFNFEEHDRLNKMGVKYEVVRRQKDGHHWVQFHTAIPHIKEDYCLFLDNDVLIWRKGIVNKWFSEAESGKFVSAFDGSGGLGSQMQEKFPILKELSAHRMGSYYFVLNREQLELAGKINLAPVHYPAITYIPELDYYTVKGDWQDSFGELSIKILAGSPEIYVIDDDRSSIYLQGTEIKKDPEEPKQLGYYHVRNGGHTTSLFTTRETDKPSYDHSVAITPQRELLRLMAWTHVAQPIYENVVKLILEDIKVDFALWENYLQEFRKYHGI